MTPLAIAQRSASWDAPENTLEAFELAVEEGTDYIEFDVRARDGELVVCHEPERMRELSALGVSGIFTDRPGLRRQTLHAHAGA